MALFLLLTVPSTADAVVPSGAKIVTRMTPPPPVPFVVNYVETAESGVARVALRVVADGRGSARLEVQLLDKERTETRIFLEQAVAESGSEPVDRAPLWLQWWMGRAAKDIVAAAGVDVTVSSLAHVGGTILWVVGAATRQDGVPQLVVERETGALRRAVAVDGETVRTSHLDAFIVKGDKTTRFPERLTLSIGGRRVTLVNTWLRIGDAARVAPKEFALPVPR